MQPYRFLFFLFFLFSGSVLQAQDTVQVMNYNLLNYPGSTPERHQELRTVVHYSEPDLVLCNELLSAYGAELLLDSAFNRFGISKYDTARFIDGPDTDNMLFFDSDKFGLAEQDTIQTQLRKIDHYKVFYRDAGLGSTHTDTSFLHLFALHLKASDGWSDEQQRAEESTKLMEHLEDLGDSAEIVVAGDLNIYEPNSEPAWDVLTDPSYANTLHDPLGTTGNWHDNPNYASIHTQSASDLGCLGATGAAWGGMDDRFDLTLLDADVLNGGGRFSYVDSSYRTLGQDGQHFDTCLTADPPVEGFPDSLVQALHQMSDHLPVVLDLEWDCRDGYVTSEDSTTICQGDTAWVGGFPFMTEAWAYDTTHHGLSCNRFDATYVDVTPVDTNVERNGDTLEASSSGTAFQWYDCEDGTAIPGETDPLFVADEEGSYAVEVTQNGCTDRSPCHTISYSSLKERKGKGLELKLYPDPGKGEFWVEASRALKNVTVRIRDLQGRPLSERRMDGVERLRMNATGLVSGIYLVEFRDHRTGELLKLEKWTKGR